MQVTETHRYTPELSGTLEADPITTLTELLQNGDEAQRCYSARALSSKASPDAEEALNNNLYHEDPDVVTDSAVALAGLKSGDSSKLIEVAKFHPEADSRLAAMDALVNMISEPEVEDLFTSLATGREDADNWGAGSDWDDWWDIQLKAVICLTENSQPRFLKVYKEILDSDPEPELEARLYQGIARHDVNWIADKLGSVSVASKRKLIKSLGVSDEDMAKVYLFKQLRSEDAVIRRLVIDALAEKSAGEYFWDIVRCLEDRDQNVQKAATAALHVFSLSQEIDQQRLINYIARADLISRPLICQLLSASDRLEPGLDAKLLELLSGSTPQALLESTELLLRGGLSGEQSEQLTALYESAMKKSESDPAILASLIRKVALIDGFEPRILPYLQDYVSRVDERTQEEYYHLSVRQAAFDALASSSLPSCRQLVRTALFGVDAFPEAIDVEVIEAQEASDELVEAEIVESKEDEQLASILAQYEEKLTEPLEIVNTPGSTLGVITQANIEAELAPAEEEPEQQQRIVDMVDELDSDLSDYAQLVKDNFESANNLDLNRKKIARLPTQSNKVLAIKSLGQSSQKGSAELLVEAILGAQPNEMREIFQSLKRIKSIEPENRITENGLGAAGNIIYHGDDLTTQAAAHFLSVMPAGKAVPLLLHALTDSNDHVRLCSLNALEVHMPRMKLAQKPLISAALSQCLKDASGGVRAQALKLATVYREKLEINLETLVGVAIDDEECQRTAGKVFLPCREEVQRLLAGNLKQLKDHHQPNAIRLIGELM